MEHSKVFSAIQAAYPKLTAAERSVADFFLQNRERGDFSSKAVAARLYVSEASLSRFAQKCGFKGYREFIYEYQRPFDEGSPFLSFSQVTKDVLARYQQLLDSSSRLVDEGQMRRVSQMLANSQRVYIYGMGSSGFAAREFALRLMRTGLLVEAITDSHMIRMNAVLVDETVTVVAITLSGRHRGGALGRAGGPPPRGPGGADDRQPRPPGARPGGGGASRCLGGVPLRGGCASLPSSPSL